MAEIKEMLENCGAYVDETCQLEGYEGTSENQLTVKKDAPPQNSPPILAQTRNGLDALRT